MTKNKAFHAGISRFGRFESLNQYSIGIENVNPGFYDNQQIWTYNNSKRSWGSTYEFPSYPEIHWLEFSEEQFVATSILVRDLQKEFKIPSYNVLTHADVAIGRKSDIGPMWDYKRSSKEFSVGYFYENRQPNLDSFSSLEGKHYIDLIKVFGYRFDDNHNEEGIRAFQMHYGWYNHRVKEKDISGELTDITKSSIINYAIGISAYKEKKSDIMDFLEREGIYKPFGEFF